MVHLLAAAYVIGFVAAAPIGPVNMLAIRRGIVGKWPHTLACGAGSALGDLMIFSLVLLGGHWLTSLSNPTVQRGLAIAGALVLTPLGVYFLVRAFREPLRAYVQARKQMEDSPPSRLVADVVTGTSLTITNPLCMCYWIAASANWLPLAQSKLGSPWWGLLPAGAGLMTWFLLLTFLVRFTPHRIGPAFFRAVNFTCGLMLTIFGLYCACRALDPRVFA
jgi:threonine/homoserine/homoserine lactone efflux protein